VGITKASLSTDSFSRRPPFQETTECVRRSRDQRTRHYLRGLKGERDHGPVIPAEQAWSITARWKIGAKGRGGRCDSGAGASTIGGLGGLRRRNRAFAGGLAKPEDSSDVLSERGNWTIG